MKRTALVTAASIAAVVITGTAAVGANIGILSSADDSPVGDLGATTEVAAPIDLVVEVPTAEPSPNPEATGRPSPQPRATSVGEDPPGSSVRTEVFQVDQAGTVVVTVSGRTVQVASVEPAAGWSWTPDDDVPDDSLDVRLESASEVLVLHVEVRSDGTLDARIDRPQPPAVASRPTAAPAHADDDRYEDDDHDDDRHEDDDHDDDRYEEEDDDHDDDRHEDEHEGRDDDD